MQKTRRSTKSKLRYVSCVRMHQSQNISEAIRYSVTFCKVFIKWIFRVWTLGKEKPSGRMQEALCLQIPLGFYMLDVVWNLGRSDGAEPAYRRREEGDKRLKRLLLWRWSPSLIPGLEMLRFDLKRSYFVLHFHVRLHYLYICCNWNIIHGSEFLFLFWKVNV
jgi:hypothetical protein